MNTEQLQAKIQSVFERLNNEQLNRIKIADPVKERMTKHLLKQYGKQLITKTEEEQEKFVIGYVVECYIKTIFENPDSKTYKKIILPRENLYHNIMRDFHKEENEKDRIVFIRIATFLYINRPKDIGIDTQLEKMYRKYLLDQRVKKEEPKKKSSFTPPKKEVTFFEKYTAQKYKDWLLVFQSIMCTFTLEEKQILQKSTSPNTEEYQEIEKRMDWAKRYYFMLKRMYKSNFEFSQELIRITTTMYPENALKYLQKKVYHSIDFTEDMIQKELEILSKKEGEQYGRMLQFLGIVPYDEQTNLLDIFIDGQNWLQYLKEQRKEKYTLYHRFFKTENTTVRKVFETFQYEYPMFYQIIIKCHGQSLLEWHQLSKEETKTYEDAIKKLRQMIIKVQKNAATIVEEGKLMVKKRKEATLRHKTIYEFFEGEEKSTVDHLVNVLKSDPPAYEIIQKAYTETLINCQELTKEEKKKLQEVIKQMRMILKNKRTLQKMVECDDKEKINQALNILKEENPQYIDILIKRHGKTQVEWHNLSKEQQEDELYHQAIKKMKQLLNPKRKKEKDQINGKEVFQLTSKAKRIKIMKRLKRVRPELYEIVVQKNGEMLEDDNRCLVDEKKYVQAIKLLQKFLIPTTQTLYSYYPDKTIAEVKKAVEKLKTINQVDYDIIIQCHGPKLIERNPLTTQEGIRYSQAKLKLKRILYPTFSIENQFPKVSHEKLVSLIDACQDTHPQYYQVIYKRAGKSLLEWNTLTEEERKIYYNAISYLKRNTKEESLKELLKESLTMEKRKLVLIKERRRQRSAKELASTYSVEEEQIYQIFAENLLLFGNQIPNILEEIIQNSQKGYEYLKQSKHYHYLIKNTEREVLEYWKQRLLMEQQFKIKQYIKIISPRKKREQTIQKEEDVLK